MVTTKQMILSLPHSCKFRSGMSVQDLKHLTAQRQHLEFCAHNQGTPLLRRLAHRRYLRHHHIITATIRALLQYMATCVLSVDVDLRPTRCLSRVVDKKFSSWKAS
ncbi:unnamed protein product [Peronospora destructor]|uniref:Uncharacterized protein n=1 Tax=Peronospora destructor TaxID=86335 RepID=A0AAV0V275_9STRA|nr:unnamed protein product [Peronospora destructor]